MLVSANITLKHLRCCNPQSALLPMYRNMCFLFFNKGAWICLYTRFEDSTYQHGHYLYLYTFYISYILFYILSHCAHFMLLTLVIRAFFSDTAVYITHGITIIAPINVDFFGISEKK